MTPYKLRPFFEAGTRLSDINIKYYCEGMKERFERTGNPTYAWTAFNVCIKARKTVPGWVTEYLFQCSERMAEADTPDLRKVLAKILGFPKRRPGPGSYLGSGRRGTDKDTFRRKFLNYILEGKDPKTARTDACNETFSRQFADKVSDKTLNGYLLERYEDLDEVPDAEEWKTIAALEMVRDKAEHVLMNANATDADREWARALLEDLDSGALLEAAARTART
jgi:hypothetical protein